MEKFFQNSVKTILTAFLAVFLVSSCASFKKTKESSTVEKSNVKTTEKEKDSSNNSVKTLPTKNAVEFNLSDLTKFMGDFKQMIDAGDGNQSVIEKKGDRLIIMNANSGSEKKEVKVSKKEKEFVYTSEYVTKEFTKIVERIPIKYWIIFWIVVAIYFRKFICQILVSIFPALGAKRIFQLFIGK